jgi:hypothetical protein
MATVNRSADDSPNAPTSVSKSAHDVGHAVDTTPLSRVNVPNTHIRESAHDVKFSVDTTPTSRVSVPESTASTAPAARPDANNGGNSAD